MIAQITFGEFFKFFLILGSALIAAMLIVHWEKASQLKTLDLRWAIVLKKVQIGALFLAGCWALNLAYLEHEKVRHEALPTVAPRQLH